MGGKQKKKAGKKKPSIFDEPMPNPFLDSPVKEKVPVKTENGKNLFDKPMDNPFYHEAEEPKKKAVPRKTGNTTIRMPARKSWEAVSSFRGQTSAVRQHPKKKKT
ncbi:MAG: hypothetical protein GY852_11515 [bacterium]|nr:hypothetical protein [bacterium]